jgi:hypothetical protein
MKDPSLHLPSSGHADSLWPLVTRISKTLGVLHQNLMVLKVKKDDHQKSRRELGDYLALRDHSHVFNLQRQLVEKPGEASKLLLMQSFEEKQNPSRQADVDHLPALRYIERPDDAQNVPDVDEIELWGSFGNRIEQDHIHIVYHD